jgi:hypothetical protein
MKAATVGCPTLDRKALEWAGFTPALLTIKKPGASREKQEAKRHLKIY